MNKPLLLNCIMAVFFGISSQANLLTNGDFETEPTIEIDYSFWQTKGWFNWAKRGDPQQMTARRNSINLDDSKYNAICNDREDEVASFVQQTEHVIQKDDAYQLSMDWRTAMDWQASDLLRVTLFATENNTLGGKVVWQESVEFQCEAFDTWANVTHAFKDVPPEAVGRTLFFNFYGFDAQKAGNVGFARVDNIFLTATPE